MAGTWSGILSERQQELYTDALELEFGAVGRCLMCVCVLGSELGFSAIAVEALNFSRPLNSVLAR